MSKSVIQFALLFVVLVVAQAVIFNHIILYGVAIPFIFIYFIIKLPINMTSAKVIFLAFLLGTVMDIFQDTPGMCGLACTCLGALRRGVLRLFVPREEDIIHSIPSIYTLGPGAFTRYVIAMTLIFCVLVFSIEAFTFFRPMVLLTRAGASCALSSILLVATDSLSRRSR